MSLVQQLDAIAEQHFSDMSTRTVRDALKEVAKNTADAAIAKEIGKLTPEQQGSLMKVVYVGLASDPANSAVYLKWHAALFEAAGPGAIIRTLTDKSSALTATGGASTE